MAKIVNRSNTIGVVANSLFVPGSSYMVTAYGVGAQVESDSAGTSVSVRAGHGFSVSDKLIVQQSSDGSILDSTFVSVDAATATTLTISGNLNLSVGDILINLGQDLGSGTPAYDASPIVTYSDMDATTVITESTVTVNSSGAYSYWVKGRCWELIRDSAGLPISVVIDAVERLGDSTDYYVPSSEYPTIQSAIDACNDAFGGVVHLDIDSSPYIENITMKSHVILDGHMSVLEPETNAAVITFNTADNVVRSTVRNLRISGLTDKATFTSSDGVLIEPGAGYFHDQVSLEKVNIGNCGRRGLSVIGASNSQFVQHLNTKLVRITDCAQQGLYMTGFVLETRHESMGVTLNQTLDVTGESAYIGDNGSAVNPKRTKFSNCYFNNNNQESGPLVHVQSAVALSFDTCLFEHTSGGGLGPDDFLLVGSSVVSGVEVSTCQFTGTGYTGDSHINLAKVDGFKATSTRFTGGVTSAFEFSATGVDQLDNVDIWDRSNILGISLLTEGANPEAKVFRAFATIDDATPPITGWKYWKTPANTGVTVTTLDGGYAGQEVFVMFTEANTTFDFSGTLKGNAGLNKTFAVDDMVRCVFDGTNWHCELMLAA